MSEETKQKIQKIASHYGYEPQSRQCIEEMAELTQAINKFWRKQLDFGKRTVLDVPIGTPEEEHIKEEIADVIITIENVKYLLAIKDADIDKIIEQKVEREMERMRSKEVMI